MIPIVTSDTATPPFNHAEHSEADADLHARPACQLVHQHVHVYRWVAGGLQRPGAIVIGWQPVSVCSTRTFLFHCLSRPTDRQGGELKCWEKLAVGEAMYDRSVRLQTLPSTALLPPHAASPTL